MHFSSYIFFEYTSLRLESSRAVCELLVNRLLSFTLTSTIVNYILINLNASYTLKNTIFTVKENASIQRPSQPNLVNPV